MAQSKVPEIEQVEWVDSVNLHGWHGEKDLDKEEIDAIVSVGYLARETENAVFLALSWDDNKDGDRMPWAQVTIIPKVSITSRRKLNGNPPALPPV